MKNKFCAVFFFYIFQLLFAEFGFAANENLKDTTLYLNGHKVMLKFTPNSVRGSIVLLQGWNFPATDWCLHTNICDIALNKGYNLIMPEMGKSIFHSKTFKETRPDWKKFPTRKWLIDTLFVYLYNHFELLNITQRNYIIGLSTGARGAVLVAMDCPFLFKGVVALSGDYNQLALPQDNLCVGYYGNYNKNKIRWKTVDNPFSEIEKLKTPIYLGHGVDDKTVPCAQTIQFYNQIKKKCPLLKAKLNTPKKGHNYQFWGSEVTAFFDFLEKL